MFNPIADNFGPNYVPGEDARIDFAANAYAMWAGRLDDRDFDALSLKLSEAVAWAGLGVHADPYDAAMALQESVRNVR